MSYENVIKLKIIKINKTYVELETIRGERGMIHISEISDYYVTNISNFFSVNQKYWFLFLNNDVEKNRLIFSWKRLHPRFLKDPFEFEIRETKSEFKNLIAKLKKEIVND